MNLRMRMFFIGLLILPFVAIGAISAFVWAGVSFGWSRCLDSIAGLHKS